MTVHALPPKRPNLAALHLAATNRLQGREFNGPHEVDPTDMPEWCAEQLPPMAKSITNAFDAIAAKPTTGACELAAAQLHHVIVHLMRIAEGLAKKRAQEASREP